MRSSLRLSCGKQTGTPDRAGRSPESDAGRRALPIPEWPAVERPLRPTRWQRLRTSSCRAAYSAVTRHGSRARILQGQVKAYVGRLVILQDGDLPSGADQGGPARASPHHWHRSPPGHEHPIHGRQFARLPAWHDLQAMLRRPRRRRGHGGGLVWSHVNVGSTTAEIDLHRPVESQTRLAALAS